MTMIFAAVHESVGGTKPTCHDGLRMSVLGGGSRLRLIARRCRPLTHFGHGMNGKAVKFGAKVRIYLISIC
jgi:hypothetical protein